MIFTAYAVLSVGNLMREERLLADLFVLVGQCAHDGMAGFAVTAARHAPYAAWPSDWLQTTFKHHAAQHAHQSSSQANT